jgi:hypothetical protein
MPVLLLIILAALHHDSEKFLMKENFVKKRLENIVIKCYPYEKNVKKFKIVTKLYQISLNITKTRSIIALIGLY